MGVFVRLLKILSPMLVVGLAAFAALTIVRSRPEVETQLPTITPPGVRAQRVTLETVQVSVSSQGTVRPRTETQLVPEIAGRVTWVAPSFAEGGFFEEGEVLLKLDRFDYEQALVAARSQLAQARLRLAQEEAEAEVAQREWDALGRGDPRELTLRVPQLEDARASVAAAEANVERAARDIARADVVAPYAGRVRTKSVDVGQFITIGAPIATIYAVDVAEVRLSLPDEELAYLDLPLAYRGAAHQRGPRVVLSTTFAGARYEWGGRVVRTESEIDPVSRMVQVVTEVLDPYAPGPDPRRPPLAVGMYVEAEIEGRSFGEVAVIPRAALRGRNQVIVIDDENRVHFRDVEILRATTEAVYVDGGLSSGELIAVSALDSPTEGMLVQVTNLDADLMTDASSREAAPLPQSHTATRTRESTPVTRGTISEQPGWLRELGDGGDLVAGAPSTADAARPVTIPDEQTPAPPVASAESAGNRRRDVNRLDAHATTPADGPAAVSTLALRPFANVSRRPEDDRLAEAVTAAVAQQVASVSSVAIIADERDAQWIISGGIQRIGDLVRITATLIDRRGGSVARAFKVDGPADELSRLQRDVAAQLSRSVREATS